MAASNFLLSGEDCLATGRTEVGALGSLDHHRGAPERNKCSVGLLAVTECGYSSYLYPYTPALDHSQHSRV